MVKTRKREPAGTPEKQKASRTSQRISARKSNENEAEKEELEQKTCYNDKNTANDVVHKPTDKGTKTIAALPDEEDEELQDPTPTSNDKATPEEVDDEVEQKSKCNNNDDNNDKKNNDNNNKEDNPTEKEIVLDEENFTEEEIAFFNEMNDEDYNPSDDNQKDVKLIAEDIEGYNDLRELDNEYVDDEAELIYTKDEEERKRLLPEEEVDLMILEDDPVSNLDKKIEEQEDKIKKHVSIIDNTINNEETEMNKQGNNTSNSNITNKSNTENSDNTRKINNTTTTLPNIEDECRFKAVIELPPSRTSLTMVS